jgi:hypothetical protein
MGAFEEECVEIYENIMLTNSDVVTFGTDASERWGGFDAVRNFFTKQLGALEADKIDTKNQVLKTSMSS